MGTAWRVAHESQNTVRQILCTSNVNLKKQYKQQKQQQLATGKKRWKKMIMKINLSIKHGKALNDFGAAFEERHTKLIELGQRDTSSKGTKNCDRMRE